MVYPIIKSKRKLKRMVILVTVFSFIVLVSLVLFNKAILNYIPYQTLLFLFFFILTVQFIFNAFVLFSNTFTVIGQIHISDTHLSVNMTKNTVNFELTRLKEIKLFSKYGKRTGKPFQWQNKVHGADSFLVFSYDNVTHIYQLYLQNPESVEKLKSKLNIHE